MTVIDDLITTALGDAANSFEPRPGATKRILDSAAAPRGLATVAQIPGPVWRHRRPVALGAAAACVVLMALAIVVASSPSPSSQLSDRGPNGLVGQPSAGLPRGAQTPTFGSVQHASGGGVTWGLKVAAPSPSDSARIEETGSLTLALSGRTIEAAVSDLSAIAIREGGYVESINEHLGTSGAGSYSAGVVVLAVPQRLFATTLARVHQVGAVSSLESQALNVTGTYVDYQSHLRGLEASRAQYLAIMRRAATIPQILQVQSQIDNIQGQIDQVEGQIQLLASETTYSTLTVNMHVVGLPSRPVSARTSSIVRAAHSSVSGFIAGVDGLIRLIGPLVFALALTTGIYFGARTLWRRRLP